MAFTLIYKKAISTGSVIAFAGSLLILGAIFHTALREIFTATMSAGVFETVVKVARIFLSMVIVIAIVRFLAFLLQQAAAKRSAGAEATSLLKTVLSIIVYIIAFFVIFQTQYPDVSLAPLFTGSTILGIVVGLALQDTLGNLFAGIAMQADQPFQLGDMLTIPNRGSGVVESISWRGVKLRTLQNKLYVISNSVLGKESFEVAPRNNLNARVITFTAPYGVSPAKVTQVVRDAIRGAENVSPAKPPVIRIQDLADSWIVWEVKVWLEDYIRFSDTDALIRERVLYAFQREGIDFPFPTRIIYNQANAVEETPEKAADAASDRLRRIPIFGPLSESEIDRLAAASKNHIYARGEVIVRSGTEGNSMFVISRGRIAVQVVDNGKRKTVNELIENDFFGEMSLLTGQPRTADIVALAETEVIQIRRSALKPILEQNPLLVQSITDIIAERKEMLQEMASGSDPDPVESKKGMLRSIRKLFGLRSA
ncbi:MAG: mechanosensitive ion channel family protein [Acidobacteria bacterium]|nr:mechanosensitive ion channel family protein [Acidobacteriota bacterium]